MGRDGRGGCHAHLVILFYGQIHGQIGHVRTYAQWWEFIAGSSLKDRKSIG